MFVFPSLPGSSCSTCNGYYGPSFGQPVCATCHAFLYANDLDAEINLQETRSFALVLSYGTIRNEMRQVSRMVRRRNYWSK